MILQRINNISDIIISIKSRIYILVFRHFFTFFTGHLSIIMENKEEYHDPDYPEASVSVKEEVPDVSEDDKIQKIKEIIHRELRNELSVRENEVTLIDQRLVYFYHVYYII